MVWGGLGLNFWGGLGLKFGVVRGTPSYLYFAMDLLWYSDLHIEPVVFVIVLHIDRAERVSGVLLKLVSI